MRKIIPVVVAGATALAVAGGTFGYVTLNKDVTLSVDGQPQQVSTAARTVGDLLSSQGITPGAHDVVAPAPSTKLADGTRVAVQFGREVTFTVDGKPQVVWTTATTLGQAITALGIDTADADLSTSRSAPIGRQGLTVDVATQKTITIDAAGQKKTLTTTAKTVAEALTVAKIKPDADDEVSVKTSTALVDGAKFSYTKVDVKSVTEKKKVGYAVVRKTSSSLEKGKTKIDKAGKTGTRAIVYREVRRNGKLTSRKETSNKVTSKPTAQIVIVGTKKVVVKVSSAGGSGVWDKIAKCESGGNWSINTGNGYYGGLQFSLSTWKAYGGSGKPHNASKAQQIAIAKKVQKAQGWGAWPACTRKLGLR
ncbi:MAG TPA: ubiquitin-like domain-containing protein [Propionibacteriaceae bacterium]